MKRWQFVKRLAPLMALLVLVLSACGREDMSALNPQGPVAQEQLNLMKISITMMSLVVIVVFAICIFVLIKFRRRKGDNTIPKQVEGSHKLEVIWTVIPIIILVILAVPTLKSVFNLSKDYSKDPEALQVIVTAHQYWWEFEYPELGITTAQELVVPTDRVISIQAATADVLHSFWIPSLAGKIDTNPSGNVNKMYFSAPKAGVYLGKCAELCGTSHGLMDFKVKAVEPSSFERWGVAMTGAVELPTDPDVASAFESKCLTCHAIGQDGSESIYPNLTGIGSRESVGGILINVEEGEKEYKHEDTLYNNLYNWIKDPEAYKPGNKMTNAYTLTDEEAKGIAEYLSNLTLDFE
ncbi:MAG: cytochrome c oxidase subunit II [Candidatus Pristimantibacillus lignocellulolyticus]|uniref:Cytochrome c oxidase subunit 2 n=1 Tax=Candidatus Pristimantibacillus lignocellulolyticus TaxID=2994561 RepID=A0A9J6Z8U7_9BACL|nr:MAG: cytochrome c oxidase subunit II [Candidatus Pristimantibacillus lignocellulolyticus]